MRRGWPRFFNPLIKHLERHQRRRVTKGAISLKYLNKSPHFQKTHGNKQQKKRIDFASSINQSRGQFYRLGIGPNNFFTRKGSCKNKRCVAPCERRLFLIMAPQPPMSTPSLYLTPAPPAHKPSFPFFRVLLALWAHSDRKYE